MLYLLFYGKMHTAFSFLKTRKQDFLYVYYIISLTAIHPTAQGRVGFLSGTL